MERLDLLLEYQVEITIKLDKAFDSLEKWFKSKSEQVKDMFEEGKLKLSETLAKLERKYKNVVGIVDVDIEASKYNTKAVKGIKGRMTVGDFVKEVASLFKELLKLFKDDCMTVIELCKYGLHELANIKARRKDRVEIETKYAKLKDSKKKLVVKFNQVETGTEVINKTLARVRSVKAELRRELDDERRVDNSRLKVSRDEYRMATGDKRAANAEYKYAKSKLDSYYKGKEKDFR